MYLFLSEDPLLIKISFPVYVIAALTDWYDGWLARKFNYITDYGKFLDPLADKVLTLAAFLSFVFIDILQLWMVLIIIVRDLTITLIRLYADYKNIIFTTSRTAQWKTFIQMAYIYYLLLVFALKSFNLIGVELETVLLDKTFIYYSMLAVTLFTLYTGVQYIVRNKKLIIRLFSFET
jgi:CDP-diacylglycerol--glycerol-3-phosphate 3-phosphatidyltransferase